MNSELIRQKFLDYFHSKLHSIAPAAPIVIKNDPTLMFTNAGMNQFKDFFLGNEVPVNQRVADTQPCLRVSGKHNDLEDVGKDTYHHTMFEMLGNWSFGDYFKQDAIDWAWDLLTNVYALPVERIYVTYFGGDATDGLVADLESRDLWKKHLPENRILPYGKKDNFWEMGDTGPCGPCSEIHIDMRSESDAAAISGDTLVNADNPEVVEIWNLVFMQFNRLSNGSLVNLPNKHVDTGMGFERLVRAIQGKSSNYDTDIFMPIIAVLEALSHKKYGFDEKLDIAFRVIADHIRAITFIIADGQMPSNNKAGYVCRRILRRAVRYGYTFLGFEEAFLYKLIDILAAQFKTNFPQVQAQASFIKTIVKSEEDNFLRTLAKGIQQLTKIQTEMMAQGKTQVSGKQVFELYDTFGFPVDLTQLMAQEQGMSIDEAGFEIEMASQKERGRKDAKQEMGDWVIVDEHNETIEFVGYDVLIIECNVVKYRTVVSKAGEEYQMVANPTPFYAESGGQVGDKGLLIGQNETVKVLDTVKENNLIIHKIDRLPETDMSFVAVVDAKNRSLIERNHSATHLMHAALRQTLGKHVEQKGSLVNSKLLRFDFSHFQKMTDEEIAAIEETVNLKIAENIELLEERNVPIEEAKTKGAMALFGEKYGDTVRVITIDPSYSVELCGGTHVKQTANIGFFKITSEGSISAGIRRVEAITSTTAFEYINAELKQLKRIKQALGNTKDPIETIAGLQDKVTHLTKTIEKQQAEQLLAKANELHLLFESNDTITAILPNLAIDDLKQIAAELRRLNFDKLIALGSEMEGKAGLVIAVGDNLLSKGINAGTLIKQNATLIQGGGGGQPFMANAGGKNADGLPQVMENVKAIKL